jgi:thiol-disulfide isomerase/thioredoxin
MRFAPLFVLAALSLPVTVSAADMQPFVRGTWAQLLKAKAGQPAVMHFWGLTCAPCLTELPHWAALKKERPGMALVMIAADPAPEDTADLKSTLTRAGLDKAESWAFADGFIERLRFEIDPKWRGEMPRTILIAHDGKATTLPGLADLAYIRKWYDAEKAKAK